MASWLKIARANVEVGGNFVLYQIVLVDMDRATGFAMQNPTNVAFFIDGKTFVVNQQVDAKSFQIVVAFAQKVTGQPLA